MSDGAITMPMTQQDIHSHYEQQWKKQSDDASDVSDLSYSNPIEDAVLYPAYEKLIRDFGLVVSDGRVLDVGIQRAESLSTPVRGIIGVRPIPLALMLVHRNSDCEAGHQECNTSSRKIRKSIFR